MPAGLPYFAWIDPGETTFTSGHMRWDESVFSFKLSQDEGDPASLTIVVRKPYNASGNPIGLLGPGRKIWCWFALDCDGTNLIKFRGRLVGIPTSIFEDLVTLEFVARPIDVVAQKEALAASLRVLPFYDEAVIEPLRRNDPDLVLEGYTAVWHYDRETHILSISDELTGEDGTVSFDDMSEDGKILYDGLSLTLTSGPLARVDVNAEFTWTQQARGTVDLTNYLVSRWPDSKNGVIYSYTMASGDWPTTGAGIGDGWVAARAGAFDVIDFTPRTTSTTSTMIYEWPDGSTSRGDYSSTSTSPGAAVGGIAANPTVAKNEWDFQWTEDENGLPELTGYSNNVSWSQDLYALQGIIVVLVAGYTAERSCTERISFSLFADVQPILTDPEDGEALRIDDIRSVNLSEGGQIGDPRRRSYITTARGNQSLEHLIALARAHLMKRARVVEITFAPKLARMSAVTLRKSASLIEPRIGTALGKIIGYSVALDGSDGRVKCEVRIGCLIGRGGVVSATAGTPTYCSESYVGPDYQQYVGRTIVVDAFADLSVGYQPPTFAPNDDGINFLGTVTVKDVMEQDLHVTFGPFEQATALAASQKAAAATALVTKGDPIDAAAEMTREAENRRAAVDTHATFKLKSMKKAFSTDYQIQLTDLKVPTGYNLETV
jgi:hypothetical protein